MIVDLVDPGGVLKKIWTTIFGFSRGANDSVTVIDNRTGSSYRMPIIHNSIAATNFLYVRAADDPNHEEDQNSQGLRLFDPGFRNTAVVKSKITYVDGLKGTIQYRGYSISDLLHNQSYTDVAFLIIWGYLPSTEESKIIHSDEASKSVISQSVFDVIKAFPRSAPPCMILTGALSCLGGTRLDAIPALAGKNLYLGNVQLVDIHIERMFADIPVIMAAIYCHQHDRPFRQPHSKLSYIANLLYMMGHVEATSGLPDPVHVHCLERLWILTADHEMSASTASLLQTASTLADPYSCLASALGAGYGILHGGAIELAYNHFAQIGTVENAQKKIEDVKARKERLMGYGHRIYKVADPRYNHIREILVDLKEEVARDPLLKVAMEIDRLASTDEFFTSRRLQPNADLFSSFAYKAMGIPVDFILPLSTLSRMPGLLAHYREAMEGDASLLRPRQLYVGDLDRKI